MSEIMCNKCQIKVEDFEKHYRENFETHKKNQKFSCECCDYITNSGSDMIRHIKTKKHQRGGTRVEYKCEPCDKTFRDNWHWQRHLLSKRHRKNSIVKFPRDEIPFKEKISISYK